jgi:hypothetical protein
MNAMGHQVPNMIGVPQKDLAMRINKLVEQHGHDRQQCRTR